MNSIELKPLIVPSRHLSGYPRMPFVLHDSAIPLQSTETYHVGFAQCDADLREAQRLRGMVFSSEYGIRLADKHGLDSDEFDALCDHIIVRETRSDEVVGTYRVLLPQQARKLGRYYSQDEFFMTRLQRQMPDLVELGRSCVHPDHRTGIVIMLLWSAIARYLQEHNVSHLIGCASVSMRDGGMQAAALWDYFQGGAMVDGLLEAFPKNPLPLDRIDRPKHLVVPPLIRGYLKLGAKVCGEPNWDPDFNSADFLMLMDLSSAHPRYVRHFGIR